jgi:solute carrier family 25 carnitine/acylcarnitine transporter 20/29
MGQMFYRATLFTCYYQFTSIIAGHDRLVTGERLTHPEYFLAGSFTGFVAGWVESPIDLLKTKMQIQIIRAKTGESVQYRNVFHAGERIYRKFGVKGLYQGIAATCLRNTSAMGIYFGTYEHLKDHFMPIGGSVKDLHAWQVFISAGTAGFLYWFLAYPTDVIKSAMQSDQIDLTKRKFDGVVDCVRTLYKSEGGLKRFYVGFAPCLMRAIPANAVMFYVLEQCRIFLNPYL